MRTTPSPVAALAVAIAVGCGPNDDTGSDDLVEGVSSSQLESTSMEIRWQGAEPTAARLRYGIDSLKENTVYLDEVGTEHIAKIHFLRPDTEYRFRVELHSDGEVVGARRGTFTTAAPPDELPELDIVVNDLSQPRLILATVLGQVMAPVVISQDGYYAWWHIEQDPALTIAQAHLSPDGDAVFYNAYDKGENASPDADYHLRRVDLDSGEVSSLEVRSHHHDFLVHEDGTLAWIQSDVRDVEGQEFKGDAIVETTADGEHQTLWTSWDHLEFDMSEECNHSGSNIWTHANALAFDQRRNSYLISLRETDSVVAVDRTTGDTLWVLGGCESDFAFRNQELFHGQHQIQRTSAGLLVYDNRPDFPNSRVAEYRLDQSAHTAELIWSYDADGAYSTTMLGDAQRLDNGDTLATWSTTATMEQVDPSGELVWQATFGFGTVLGYNTLLE